MKYANRFIVDYLVNNLKKIFWKFTSKSLAFSIFFALLSEVSINIWHIHEHEGVCEHNSCCGSTNKDYSSVVSFDKTPWVEDNHIECLLCLAIKYQFVKGLYFHDELVQYLAGNRIFPVCYSFFSDYFNFSFFGRAPPYIV